MDIQTDGHVRDQCEPTIILALLFQVCNTNNELQTEVGHSSSSTHFYIHRPQTEDEGSVTHSHLHTYHTYNPLLSSFALLFFIAFA